MASPVTSGAASGIGPGSGAGTEAGPQSNAEGSRTASASLSPSLQIASDILAASSAPTAPVVPATISTDTAPKGIHDHDHGNSSSNSNANANANANSHGIGIRTAAPSSNGTTPLHSPALPSPSVLSPQPPSTTAGRPSPVTTKPPQPMTSRLGHGQWRVQTPSSQPTKTKSSMPKVSIVDPPAPGTGRQAAVASSGFPSPGRENMQANPKLNEDRTRITYGIQQSIPEAVRRSVRDNWEKCLLGSDFHQAFVLNASIHHASHAAVRRGMRDFGKAMIIAAKHEIIDQMTPTDLDQLADRILAKVSNSFLDKALERRIKTIEAAPLINALARAERLGYESSDVVEDPAAYGGRPVAQPSSDLVQSSPGPAPRPPFSTMPLHCAICFRKFNYQSSYEHHVKGKVCTRSPNSPGGFKFSCQHCGQGFTTVMGLQYHNANKVCGDFGEPVKVPRDNATLATLATPAASRISKMVTSATPKPTPKALNIVESPNGTPGLHTPHGAIGDPYAHLSPEQLAAMQQELRDAEYKYGERMRQANMIPDEAEKKQRIDGLSNSFGTKQSLIRKKYGVRLRMRRTKAEILSERDRMQYRTAAELMSELGITGISHGPGRPTSSTLHRPRPSAAVGAAAHQALTTSNLAFNLPVQVPSMDDDPSTMDVTMHGSHKRRFPGSNMDSPNYKRVAYSQMGGLGSAAAAAEMNDPTLLLRVDSAKGKRTADEPMALGDTSESDSDDSSEDIPAQLPASVRQSLQSSSPVALGADGNSRPGSISTE